MLMFIVLAPSFGDYIQKRENNVMNTYRIAGMFRWEESFVDFVG